MKSITQKKKLLKKSRLYIILDKATCRNDKNIIKIANQIEKGSVDIVQLRYKSDNIKKIVSIGKKLQPIIKRKNGLFIINDRPDVALASNADGVHLGQDDISPEVARKVLGKRKILGLSCHSLEQALKAQKDPNIDYIGIGPIFSTALKPNCKAISQKIIPKINKRITKPFFVIGGINLKNMKDILQAGGKRISLCRAICEAINIRKKIKLIKNQLHSN